MSEVVSEPMQDVLDSLEAVLWERAPFLAEALQPGLTAEQVGDLERESGVRLTAELRLLYQWHDGADPQQLDGPLPGHTFKALRDALADRAEMLRQVHETRGLARLAHMVFTGHRDHWMPVFDDGAGDGYFYDPCRRSVFWHFAEDGSFVHFPCLRNLLAGIVEGWQSGVFSADRNRAAEDHERSGAMWDRYGVANVR